MIRIVLSLLLAVAVVEWCGLGLAALAGRRIGVPAGALRAPLGYAFALIASYHLFFLFGDMHVAAAAVLLAATAANAACLVWARKTGAAWTDLLGYGLNRRQLVMVGLLLVAVAGTAGWPYMKAGWGQYWHTGSEDVDDAIAGRDDFIQQRFVHEPLIDFRELGPVAPPDASRESTRSSELSRRGDELREEEARRTRHFGSIRFQYSSVAFWSAIVGDFHRLDAFLIQALLNLTMMAWGVYWLARRGFDLGDGASLGAAAGAVLGHFYMATYYNGHEGSMIYGALAPAALLLFVLWMGRGFDRRSFVHWLPLALFLYAIAYTYPFPLVFLLPAMAGCALWQLPPTAWRRAHDIVRGREIAWIAAALIGLSLAVVALWIFAEGYRHRAENFHRPWGITHTQMIFPLFWGLVPSGSIDGPTLFGPIARNVAIYGTVTLAALVLFGIVAAHVWRRAKTGGWLFLAWFLVFWPLMGVAMRVVVVDPYYLFKFLYTHHFLFAIGLASALASGMASPTVLTRAGSAAAATVLLAVNLGWNWYHTSDIAGRAYNRQIAEFEALRELPRETLDRTAVALTGGFGTAAWLVIKEAGAVPEREPRLAQYLLGPSTRAADITEAPELPPPLWSNALLALRPSPARNHVVVWSNFPQEWEPGGQFGDAPFRWIGQRGGDRVAIYIERPDLSTPYLRFCAALGPSVERSSIELRMTDHRDRPVAGFRLSGASCHWLDLRRHDIGNLPLWLRSGEEGKSLLPVDDRFLIYRLAAVGMTDEVYDPAGLALLNRPHDIVQRPASPFLPPAPGSVWLGNGWWSFERHQGREFRWSTNDAEIVIYRPAGNRARVEIDIETGPSLGASQAMLRAIDAGGAEIGRAEIGARRIVRFDIPCTSGRTCVARLRADSRNLPVPGDPRILNFRVFRIAAQDAS